MLCAICLTEPIGVKSAFCKDCKNTDSRFRRFCLVKLEIPLIQFNTVRHSSIWHRILIKLFVQSQDPGFEEATRLANSPAADGRTGRSGERTNDMNGER